MAWTGDKNNPVPNIGSVKTDLSNKVFQESSNVSEKIVEVNRAAQVRRDTDTQKNNTVGLMDIDTAVLKQLEKLQLTIIDDGNQIKVPTFYASPEKWKSIQKDGVIRDYNGKLILPAIVYQRTNTERDESHQTFNRYLTYSVLKKYSEKNRYTKFGILSGQNKPVHEVYDVVMPDYMTFNYEFIIWTEYVEQMNTLVERFNFETDDYWGELKGLRFRTRIDSYEHAIELQVDQDRMVKTTFNLSLKGYLLPDIIAKFKGTQETTRKWLTPKKLIIGTEVVATDFDLNKYNEKNLAKWRNQDYPNLPAVEHISKPSITNYDPINARNLSNVVNVIISNNNSFHLPAPTSSSDAGQEGWVSYDTDYYYVYTGGNWKRIPIALFNDMTQF